MTENTRIIDYEFEIERDFRKKLRFYLKELELVQEMEHVDEILGEILYLGIITKDIKIKAYINRKIKEFARKHPEIKKKKKKILHKTGILT